MIPFFLLIKKLMSYGTGVYSPNRGHPYHILPPSPWPILTAINVLFIASTFVICIHRTIKPFGIYLFFISVLSFIITLFCWWNDVINESFSGHHTKEVVAGLRIGFALFIISEVIFFFGFFWSFFYYSLSPAIQIGCMWPPAGITPIDPLGLPLSNTLFLLTSGLSVTYAHRAVLNNDIRTGRDGLKMTLKASYCFLLIQFFEYLIAPFSIADSVYGSIFFLLTGFHGFHVLIGTIYLRVCLHRHGLNHFTPTHHVGLETAIWYWHFVDVVWIFLYIFVYIWGGYKTPII
jgi:heme/copper-type cytochrome/quinol oxidase subunit 3